MSNSIKKIVSILFLINVFFVSAALAQLDTLDLNGCIAAAVKNNPQIKISEAGYEGNEANVMLTRSALMPQASLVSSGLRTGGTSFIGPTARLATYNNFAAGFQGQMLIFDFGKSISKLNSAADLADASQYDLDNTIQTIELNTTIAYYNYLQSKRIDDVNMEIVRQSEEHLKESKSFFEVGRKPQFDVIKAETDLANARLNLIRSKNNIKLALLQLADLMGVKLNDNVILKDNLENNQKSGFELNDAMTEAFKNRPDYLSSLLRLEANKSLVTSAWTTHLPSINATGTYNWKGFDLGQKFNNGWTLGLSFSLPVFQGWGIDAAVQIAKANLKSSEYSNEYLKQQIILDVQQQYLGYSEAEERILAGKKLVEQAEETLKLAEGRYSSEVGSAIEVTDARVTLLNAQISYIQALYDSKISLARLKKAMGVK